MPRAAPARWNVDISQTDAYYFSPQKAFGSDGGLWIAVLSGEDRPRLRYRLKASACRARDADSSRSCPLDSPPSRTPVRTRLNTPAVLRWSCCKPGAGLTTMATLPGHWRVACRSASPCTSGRERVRLCSSVSRRKRTNAVVTIDLDEHQRFLGGQRAA